VDNSRYTYTNSRMRVIHALLGVLTFLLVNGLLLGVMLFITHGWAWREPEGSIVGLATLLVNVGLLTYFGFTRYWFTLGPLTLFALLFSGVLLFSSACFPAPPLPAPTRTPRATVAPQSPLEPPRTSTPPITETVTLTESMPLTESVPITEGEPVSPTGQSN
jgi:hypothetical protein